jgi:nucleoside-diphosphate-sugar epimerase
MPAMPASNPPALFCFGLGFTASRLARVMEGEGWPVAGTANSSLQTVRAYAFTRGRPLAGEGLAALRAASHILISIPPDAEGDMALDHHALDMAGADWIGYLSTTGVYGDTGGAWVDESAALKPTSPRSRWRVEAENAWREFGDHHEVAVNVFRLAGIYGPGRSQIDRVRAGDARRIDKPDHLFSRIHVVDIVRVLARDMRRNIAGAIAPGEIWNLCDDEPATPADVTAEACRLLGVEAPPLIPFAEAERAMTPMARSFWLDNRRVDNRKVKRDLDLALLFPTYREGLKGILAADG